MTNLNWECPKCNNTQYEEDVLAATGGGVTKFFNVQNKKFITVSCTKCRYTEMYKTESGTLENIIDFFGN